MGLVKVNEVEFFNPPQRDFYYATARNQCFSGGFNNGKSWAGCLKAYTLLSTFPFYRFAICRQVRADLMKTTYQTFFKICPREFVLAENKQEGWTIFKNGSRVDWLHMDQIDESTLRGLEINSYLWDQAEEGDEKTYDILNARIARWDQVEVPQWLLDKFPDWPKAKGGNYIVPSYGILLVNPDTQFHWVYRKYHPESLEKLPNHYFIEGQWDPNMGSRETFEQALTHDEEWIDKYVYGKWGISNAQIHRVRSESYLDYSDELIADIRRRGNLHRILDHGESSPTCCLWCASLDGNYIFYREYYVPNQVISFHRKSITELSEDEYYTGNYADPQIFKKTGQKDGGFWTTADEYGTTDVEGPPLHWIPADNNEFATRNRINELLKPQDNVKHPVTKKIGKYPRIFFVRKSVNYPFGVEQAIIQVGSQRRKLIGYIDGKALYSDDREESVIDHAYDCVRYEISVHGLSKKEPKRKVPRFSIEYYKALKNRMSKMAPKQLN